MTTDPTLRIATYNINGVRSRIDRLIEWLQREAPDIVCLQELKAADEAFPAADVREAGYGALWHGQKSWNGVAILARGVDPVERRRGLPGDDSDTQSRYLEADVRGLIVGCLYLPNGNPWPGPKFDYKLAWFDRLIAHAGELLQSGQPVVLAGDYNVVPSDEDIYDPRNWRRDALLKPETRERYARLLAQGWTDAIAARFPGERVYTFWDYFRNHWARNAGLRIDHLLLSPDLAPRLADAGVDRWVRDRPSPSDHAPTWVRIGLKATSRGGGAAAGRAVEPGRSTPGGAALGARGPAAGPVAPAARTRRSRPNPPTSAAPGGKSATAAKTRPSKSPRKATSATARTTPVKSPPTKKTSSKPPAAKKTSARTPSTAESPARKAATRARPPGAETPSAKHASVRKAAPARTDSKSPVAKTPAARRAKRAT